MQFRAQALFFTALVVAAAANPVPAAEPQVEARQIGDFVTSVFGEATAGAASLGTNIASNVQSVATGVATTLTSGAAGAFSTVTSVGAGVGSTITSGAGGALSTVTSAVTPNGAVGSVNAPAYLTPVFMLAAGIAGVGAVLL